MTESDEESYTEEDTETVEYWKSRCELAKAVITDLLTGKQDTQLDADDVVKLVTTLTDSLGVLLLIIDKNGAQLNGGYPADVPQVKNLILKIQDVVSDAMNSEMVKVKSTSTDVHGNVKETLYDNEEVS